MRSKSIEIANYNMHNILFENYAFVNAVHNLRNVWVKSKGQIHRRIDSRLFKLYAWDYCKLWYNNNNSYEYVVGVMKVLLLNRRVVAITK